MRVLTWRGWLLVVLVGFLVAVVCFTGLRIGAHLWDDHRDYHLVIDVLKYNIQQGHLAPLPAPNLPPPPASEQK